MMLIKSFFRRIAKDFRHKELLPLKLIFFVQASTLYVLYPYLTIHMRELGINVEETAIMSAVTPIAAIVMPPLAGMFADRVGNFRILLSFFSSLGGVAALLLLLVPIGRVTVEFPERVIMDASCAGKNGELIYSMSQNHPCETDLSSEIATKIESCGYACHIDEQNETNSQALLTSRLYTIMSYDFKMGTNDSFKYTASLNNIPQDIGQIQDMRINRKLRNNEFFKTSVRRLSKNTYFFPTNPLYEFSCSPSTFLEDFDSVKVYENRTLCTFGEFIDPSKEKLDRTMNRQSYLSTLNKLEMTEEDIEEERQKFIAEKVSWNGEIFEKVICKNSNEDDQTVVVKVPLLDYAQSPEPYQILDIENCVKKCIVSMPRKEVCLNMDMQVEYNITLTFWLYLVIRVFIGIIGGTTFAMFEGAVIAILREQEADYGLQRIYGSIGGMISSPLSGLLIDYASRDKGYTDFRPAFYLYAALKLISGFLMLAINLEFKSPATNVVSDVLTVLKNVEVVALFIACFILGTAWGYIESFLFWLIQDLGGSRSLMGITITVGGIAGIPLLVLSGPIISKIGHANVLFIGFVFYAVRLCGYSLIYNPWLTLIFEALESVTSSLSFTAAVTYAAKLSTSTTDTSIQGLLGGLYYGVGKGSGSLIGGYLMKAFGTRPTYQIFAVISLVTGLIYFFFNALYLKKRPQVEGNDIVKKKPKTIAENQNGLDRGIVEIALDEKNQHRTGNEKEKKSIDALGIDNESFVKEKDISPKDSKDLETINNAKNLETIEKSSITINPEKIEGQNGLMNPNKLESQEDEDCNITIELRPNV
ncbi:Major facilitator superfamily domain-containing protein 6-A [Vespula maculifrons]|uniref:Major facilitator superfamily domain-containing protein 6-A n=1 Tax=Vespula maculifrons TaxID=7453 RepID=A0ABD2CZH4_VESMC